MVVMRQAPTTGEGVKRISAKKFWAEFQVAAKELPAEGYGPSWTAGMYTVLHRVQQSLGLWCACRLGHATPHGQKGEYLKIDFMWFAADSGNWAPPVVAIEHENAWEVRETVTDFWRVSQVCAPLRVCIGYTKTRAEAERLGPVMLDTSRENGWRRVEKGEDLVVLGYDGMAPGDFLAWLLTDEGSKEL
jgi:hypothetical protein